MIQDNNTKVVKFIGDIHGKFPKYTRILRESDVDTIQVGDFAFGFGSPLFDGDTIEGMIQDSSYHGLSHRMIRGNHDKLEECRKCKNYIPDGTVEMIGNSTVMFVGGAFSIDRDFRTEGVDYWSDEELSQSELFKMIDIYEERKPDVMVTHECPAEIFEWLLHVNGRRMYDKPSKTSQALSSMLGIHLPYLWVFGHHHTSFDEIYKDKTRFICLNELETIDLIL